MKTFSRFLLFGLLVVSIGFVSGCATTRDADKSSQTKNEYLNGIGESAYDLFWVDEVGNPRSH